MSLTKQDKQDVQEIVEVSVGKAIDELSGVIANFAQSVHNEFQVVHKELDTKANQSSLDRLTNTIDAFVKRLDDTEVETAARDAQFERLLQWAREVSAKTGIPLKNL